MKLDVLKLSTDGVPLYATLDPATTPEGSSGCHLFLNSESFKKTSWQPGINGVRIPGTLYNFNKLVDFRNLDKTQFLRDRAQEMWDSSKTDINNSVAFDIISFADLKKYIFCYWVCIPSFAPRDLLIEALDTVNIPNSGVYQEWFTKNNEDWVCLVDQLGGIHRYSIDLVRSLEAPLVLCIRDLGCVAGVPSTIAKNILAVFQRHCPKVRVIRVYFIRPRDKSFGIDIRFTTKSGMKDHKNDNDHDVNIAVGNHSGDHDDGEGINGNFDSPHSYLKVSGWEKRVSGKSLPRAVDLSELVDSSKIGEQAVDLNLKLMRWRVQPDLDLEIIKNTRVLLLGAGTLGCYVARSLMAWGVRRITFVDNSTVSFSNPVRQPLFEFSDCGKPKALAAAEALKRILPAIEAVGVELTIPMIGHPMVDEAKEHKAYDRLLELFKSHDAIFLLLDSREARWLPTVIGTSLNKIVINVALGFDSYLVMRHGVYNSFAEEDNDFADKSNAVPGNDTTPLGCYFCSDVVVPSDSQSDRTLDQMCTVTRPGVAPMASAQAVELLVSLLQRKMSNTVFDSPDRCILGEVPHQIRGFLDRWSTLSMKTQAYEHCSACSPTVVGTYKVRGWDFVKDSVCDDEYIDRISGLYEMKRQTDMTMVASEVDSWGFDEVEDGN